MQRILMGHRCRDFRQITTRVTSSDFDLRIARYVQRVVAVEREPLSARSYLRCALQTDQAGLMIIVGELNRRITGINGDATIVQVARRRLSWSHSSTAAFAFVRPWYKAGFRCDGCKSFVFAHD